MESKPQAQMQPDQELYPAVKLELFRTFTRESFAVAFGQAPPIFDPSSKIKTWFDSTVGNNPEDFVMYKAAASNNDGTYKLKAFYMTALEASLVNIPPGEASTDPSMLTAKSWSCPCRDLLPNEAFARYTMGVPGVMRTDKRQSVDESEGRFTPADRDLLQRIAADVAALKAGK